MLGGARNNDCLGAGVMIETISSSIFLVVKVSVYERFSRADDLHPPKRWKSEDYQRPLANQRLAGALIDWMPRRPKVVQGIQSKSSTASSRPDSPTAVCREEGNIAPPKQEDEEESHFNISFWILLPCPLVGGGIIIRRMHFHL